MTLREPIPALLFGDSRISLPFQEWCEVADSLVVASTQARPFRGIVILESR
jgi:hypothetical protein